MKPQDYILFGAIILLIIFIVVYLVISKKKNPNCKSGCTGCPLANNCSRKK